MNNNTFKLGKSLVMSALFFAVVFSLAGGAGGSLHIWVGSLLLLSAVIHLIFNRKWITIVFSQPIRILKKRVRRLRRINLCLFIFGGLCGLTGVSLLLTLGTGAARLLAGLHSLSGFVVILLMGIHMLLHWNWLVYAIKRMAKPQRSQPRKPAHGTLSPSGGS